MRRLFFSVWTAISVAAVSAVACGLVGCGADEATPAYFAETGEALGAPFIWVTGYGSLYNYTDPTFGLSNATPCSTQNPLHGEWAGQICELPKSQNVYVHVTHDANFVYQGNSADMGAIVLDACSWLASQIDPNTWHIHCGATGTGLDVQVSVCASGCSQNPGGTVSSNFTSAFQLGGSAGGQAKYYATSKTVLSIPSIASVASNNFAANWTQAQWVAQNTAKHELAHAIGLPHNTGSLDLMHPTPADGFAAGDVPLTATESQLLHEYQPNP